jgi:hypothetical protein
MERTYKLREETPEGRGKLRVRKGNTTTTGQGAKEARDGWKREKCAENKEGANRERHAQ